MELSECGKYFYEYVQKAKLDYNNMRNEILRIKQKEHGVVDFVSDDMKFHDMVLIPFSDGDYEWKICMLTRKNEPISNGVDIFQKHVKDWVDGIMKGIINR